MYNLIAPLREKCLWMGCFSRIIDYLCILHPRNTDKSSLTKHPNLMNNFYYPSSPQNLTASVAGIIKKRRLYFLGFLLIAFISSAQARNDIGHWPSLPDEEQIAPPSGEFDTPLDSIRLSDPAILADKKTQMYYMTGTGGMMWRPAANGADRWSPDSSSMCSSIC